jgi:hypothetical protein
MASGDTPLHLAAAGLRHDAAPALLAVGAPADTDRNGVAVADRIQSQALREALAG